MAQNFMLHEAGLTDILHQTGCYFWAFQVKKAWGTLQFDMENVKKVDFWTARYIQVML